MSSNPVTGEEVEAFLTKLKAADAEKKVDQLQLFSLRIDGAEQLPDTTIDPITLLVAPLLKSSAHLLVAAVLTSFLPVFLPLIPDDPPANHLRLALHQFLPLLLEKLNDQKERVHSAAASALTILGKKCYESEPPSLGASTTKGKSREGLVELWERGMKDVLGNKGWRGKVEGMKAILEMRRDMGSKLPLKPWLAPLVGLLEDSDGNVRDQARETVVALLSPANTPAAARAELKKLMQARNVRKTIADGIISRIFSNGAAVAIIAADIPLPADDAPVSTLGTRSGAVTPAHDEVEVVYVNTAKELEQEFSEMIPHFAGKETEHNWLPREKAIIRIRGILRTTVAQQSCAVVTELAETLGPAFDHFVELILPVLGKMAGFTKKIIAERSQRSVSAIIEHTTVHPRIFISHISSGVSGKNIQARHACTGHLKTFLDVHGIRSKHSIETTSGLLDMIDTTVRTSLVDVNPQVRDLARLAFWSYHAVWPQKANVIMTSMDNIARKQLEKARTGETNGVALTTRPPAPAKRASSAISAVLAEKKRARAAELAAGKSTGSPRIVSSPVPASPVPSLPSGTPRSTSSTFISSKKPGPFPRTVSSPGSSSEGSPRPRRTSTRPVENGIGSEVKKRTSSLSRPLSSNPSSRESSTSRQSPLRQFNTYPNNSHTPTSQSSSAASTQVVRTPTLNRKHLPSFSGHSTPSDNIETGVGLGLVNSSEIHPEHRKRIAETEAATQRLEAYSVSHPGTTPFTPKVHHGGSLQTPINGMMRNHAWVDSPRSDLMTPMILDKLKERKHERSWWLKRQQLLDKASPLKSTTNTPSSAITEDVISLEKGNPEIRNLQKLALFSSSHPISQSTMESEDEFESDKSIWNEGRLFERVFDGLVAYLEPTKPFDLLEQALVVLWEMVQHQWDMFEDHETTLCDALFRLRACKSSIILESTNSLISFLTEVSDPLFLLSVLSASLDRYLVRHPPEEMERIMEKLDISTSSTINGAETGQKVLRGEKARASGYSFGLNAMGMCVLRLPKEVVRIEGKNLAGIIMTALSSPTITTRQAANTLILALQCVLQDAQETLGLLPELNAGQKDLAMYLMDKNGLLVDLLPGESGGREGVMGEMTELMARSARG
ncbi:hypothetical protein TREMEDRAFT_42004 [Tremella mesenterica DSM 1558]|uniref:uncharacterized protein n=1 Tax=Tremella mesenterica (strain ATCC 24925 / CBS 8224 / DSM 1558 / NBRC 9311 / NRRL Y-6157 / RJB 2259-6 / UBC 559-6) TaxID=578456 RepID=UPI0003F49359|nr:uncharacterized protein TREMEDRAFT_42004 [Tremella mesenterica DSM 1558]EIW72825.1 hypothetical protein TREMEDRAFT_42004 [Tremella mesenterica DSM 1558]